MESIHVPRNKRLKEIIRKEMIEGKENSLGVPAMVDEELSVSFTPSLSLSPPSPIIISKWSYGVALSREACLRDGNTLSRGPL